MLNKVLANKKLLLRFVVVGIVGFVFNYTVLKIGIALHLNKVVSEIIAVLIALQITFLLHDNWTYFEHRKKNYHLHLQTRYGRYIVSNSFGSVITIVLFAAFSSFLGHFISLALAASIAMIWNFLANKLLIWKHKTTEVLDNL